MISESTQDLLQKTQSMAPTTSSPAQLFFLQFTSFLLADGRNSYAKAWLGEINEYAQDDVVIMLIGNKADAGSDRVVQYEDGERLAKLLSYGHKYSQRNRQLNCISNSDPNFNRTRVARVGPHLYTSPVFRFLIGLATTPPDQKLSLTSLTPEHFTVRPATSCSRSWVAALTIRRNHKEVFRSF
ncbi:hypothetical protein AVEN_26905-1 [Araneus ventricosus]|uniref:Uncharacterized protein n=1 Tax=Araneus ventricosus TaxID=182803 RepID=A0A4Y2U4K4_ARAVE|nr:hypothetical protein AVEN_26905-1 [Araneus ventricosus]